MVNPQVPEPHIVPEAQSATQQVVLALSIAFIVFILSGPNAQSGLTTRINSLRPGVKSQPIASQQTWITANAAVGWGVVFLTLIALADIESTSKVAVAFAWLVMISMFLTVGTNAATNLANVQGSFGNTGLGVGAGATGHPSTTTSSPQASGVGAGATGKAH